MLGRILVGVGHQLCRHRDNWMVAQLNRAIQILYLKTENDNYNFKDNGEERAVEILANLSFNTFVDVGANRGAWSVMVKKHRPTANIHAFEASPITFLHTQRVLEIYQDVELKNLGLYDRKGQMDFFQAEDDGRSSLFRHSPQEDNLAKLTVEVLTLDDYAMEAELDTIDFLKIDTEGADYSILEGCCNLMSTRRIKVIQFEYGFVSVDTGHLLKDYYALLRRNGFVVGKIYPTSVEFRDYDRTMENFIGPNFIAVRDDLSAVIQALG